MHAVPHWLHLVALAWLALSAASALVAALDEAAGHAQSLWIMDVVWPVKAGAPREWTDAEGAAWLVWVVRPSATRALLGDFARGWLVFQNGANVRRLAPPPDDWRAADGDRMRLYFQAAVPGRHTLNVVADDR